MTSPAPREPLAPSESVRAVFEQLDADPKLEGKGLSEAFARSFPDPPVEAEALAATEAARMAVILVHRPNVSAIGRGSPLLWLVGGAVMAPPPVFCWQFTYSPNHCSQFLRKDSMNV